MPIESREMVQMNGFARQKQRHRCREQTYGHQGWRVGDGGAVMNWEVGIGRCKLMDKQQGPNVQHRELYSIFCDTIMEKNILKMYICV